MKMIDFFFWENELTKINSRKILRVDVEFLKAQMAVIDKN